MTFGTPQGEKIVQISTKCGKCDARKKGSNPKFPENQKRHGGLAACQKVRLISGQKIANQNKRRVCDLTKLAIATVIKVQL